MCGNWLYFPETDDWRLLVGARLDITISSEALATLCDRTNWSVRQALAWVATRPAHAPEQCLKEPETKAA